MDCGSRPLQREIVAPVMAPSHALAPVRVPSKRWQEARKAAIEPRTSVRDADAVKRNARPHREGATREPFVVPKSLRTGPSDLAGAPSESSVAAGRGRPVAGRPTSTCGSSSTGSRTEGTWAAIAKARQSRFVGALKECLAEFGCRGTIRGRVCYSSARAYVRGNLEASWVSDRTDDPVASINDAGDPVASK